MANQSAGVYAHGVPVTASPVHGGLVPVHGGLSPMHGQNGIVGLGRNLGDTGGSNLLANPQDFSASWIPQAGVVTVNTGGQDPLGGTTADKFAVDGTNALHHMSQAGSFGAGPFTFSVFAKPAGYPRIGFRVFDGLLNFMQATFDISVGNVVNVVNGSPFIKPVGSGWFFLGLSATSAGNAGAASGWQIQSMPAGVLAEQAYLGDGVSGALLWQGQVVAGLNPGPIIFA